MRKTVTLVLSVHRRPRHTPAIRMARIHCCPAHFATPTHTLLIHNTNRAHHHNPPLLSRVHLFKSLCAQGSVAVPPTTPLQSHSQETLVGAPRALEHSLRDTRKPSNTFLLTDPVTRAPIAGRGCVYRGQGPPSSGTHEYALDLGHRRRTMMGSGLYINLSFLFGDITILNNRMDLEMQWLEVIDDP